MDYIVINFRATLATFKNHIDAYITHFENGVILTASTREPLISQQLHRYVSW